MEESPATRGDLSTAGDEYYDGDDWGWQPLWLSRAEVLAACREAFGMKPTGATLLHEGMLNQSWRISASDHDRVLRISRTERTVEQVTYEHRLASAWAEVEPAVVVAEHDTVPVVDDHALTLFPFVAGVPGTAVVGPLRARLLAPVIARLHRVSLELDLPQRPGFAAIDDRPRWHGWDRVRAALVERFGDGADVLRPIDVVDRATAHLDILLDHWRESGRLDHRGAVHGDLNPRNQLYRDEALVGLIDTDDCRVEPLVWDVANLAYSERSVSPGSVWRDYLAAGGSLEARDEDLLVPFARIGALTSIIWMTDDAGAATHLALHGVTELAAQLTGDVGRDD